MTLRRHGLSQRRKAVGFTQESFADRLSVERTTVVRWEAGETEPLPGTRPKIARALQISVDQLSQLLSETHEERRGNGDHCSDASESDAPSHSLVAINSLSANRGRHVDPDADILAMWSFRAADQKVGGGHLYATVVDYLHTELAPRLFDVGPGADGKQVFTSAAALTEMVGWMAHDAGKNAAAWRYFLRALDLVRIGGDHQLVAHIFASMSHVAHYRHQPNQAVQLARQGVQALQGGPPQPPLYAQLLAMQAKGMAALRQSDECTKLLIDAERVLSGPVGAYEPSLWVSHFDEGAYAHEVARCMYQLGHLNEAQRQAHRVLQLRPLDRTRSRAFGQLTLVTALIAQGDADQACTVAHDVLNSTQSLGSYVVIQQLTDLKELLQPYHKNRAVADFLACLDQALCERLWLYQWLSKDDNECNGDFLEDA